MSENKIQETKPMAGGNKMGYMPIPKLLFTMSAPMMASMLFQALYNIVDSYFVAKLSQDALNAVGLAFPIQTLSMAMSLGTGVGINAMLSRALGAKDQEGADRAANTGIFLFIVSAFLFMILGNTCGRLYYSIQTSNEQIISYGTAYVGICIGLCLPLYGQILMERLLQSTGRTGLSMVLQIVGAVINMIMDPILIFGLFGFPRMEVAGAAAATLFGQTAATLLGIYFNMKKNPEIHIRLSMIRPHRNTIKEIYRVGIPSIIMQAIGSIMNFGLNKILISFTEAATAAFSVYYKVQSFIFMPVFGMNSALVPIISFNFGAKRADRVKQTIKLSLLTAFIIMAVGCLIFEVCPGLLINIFSPTDEMLRVGIVSFRIIGTHFPIASFCIIVGSVCQALGKSWYSMITSILRQIVVLLPAAYLLSLTGVLDYVWLAFPIAEVFSAAFNVYFLSKTMKHANKVMGE